MLRSRGLVDPTAPDSVRKPGSGPLSAIRRSHSSHLRHIPNAPYPPHSDQLLPSSDLDPSISRSCNPPTLPPPPVAVTLQYVV